MSKFIKSVFGKKPRELPAIHGEYAQLCQQLGQAQYQVFVYTEEVRKMQLRLLEINREAAKRQELETNKKPSPPPAEPKKGSAM